MSPPGRVVRLAGHPVRIADDQPSFWDRVEAGTWEPGTLAAYRAEVGPGTFVLDLGAWVGPLALLAAALGACVTAVEADPAALGQLRGNLAANPALAARIDVVAAAVTPVSGPVRLGARRKPGDSMSSVLLAGGVTAWTADGVTPAELAAATRPGQRLFVKLDIEGGEYGLLPTLASALDGAGTRLLVSLHPQILAETGETDPAGRALAALSPFTGWTAQAVTPDGPVGARIDRETLATHDVWLLRQPI